MRPDAAPRVLSFALALLLLSGCAPSAAPLPTPTATKPSPTAAPAPTLQKVKVAHAPSVLFAPLYIAIERAYFEEVGIEPQLEIVTAGQDAMALAAAGQLDAVVAGFAAATFNAVDRGLDIEVVASMGAQPEKGFPSALMVRKDLLDSGQVKSIADLKGRRVAIAGGGGSTGSYWVALKLAEAGLTLKDIDMKNLSFPDMALAFTNKSIDAAFPPAPFTTQIIKEGLAGVFGGPVTPGASAVGVVYGGKFMKERPEVARNFMVALVRAARELQGEQYYSPESLAIFSKYTKLPVDTLRGMDRYSFDPNLAVDTRTLENMQKTFMEAGYIKYSTLIPISRVVDQSFTAYAVAKLGPYRR